MGFADCDQDLSAPGTNGCEAALAVDKNHCGQCGTACFYSCKQGNCTDPIDISTGIDHACAVLGTGQVYCWGNNTDGQVGNGLAGTVEALPVLVALPSPAVQVTCGGNPTTVAAHTCALLADGSVFCWGTGQSGQLGNGSLSNSPVPKPVPLPSGAATQVTAGSSHSCAATDAGLFCWGNNSVGQLGNGQSGGTQALPVPVQGPPLPVADAGLTYTCGIDANMKLFCWGIGQYGKLGIGTTASQVTPASVPFGGALGVTAGAKHTCAWTDTQAACWGDNLAQEVGVPGSSQFTTPAMLNLPPVRMMSAGTDTSAAVTKAGDVFIWGSGYLGDGSPKASFPSPKANGLSGIRRVQVGGATMPPSSFACALRQSGELVCWGDASKGQLGNGDTMTQLSPVTVKL